MDRSIDFGGGELIQSCESFTLRQDNLDLVLVRNPKPTALPGTYGESKVLDLVFGIGVTAFSILWRYSGM